MDLLIVYTCICFGRYLQENQALPKTNSNYAWLSFIKKIHAMSFVFNFSCEILFLFDRSITHIWQIFPIHQVKYRQSAIKLMLIPRVWGSRVSTSPFVYSLKRPINYFFRIFTILCMIFKKRPFIEALCKPLFTKCAHCKPLFPFQNNV